MSSRGEEEAPAGTCESCFDTVPRVALTADTLSEDGEGASRMTLGWGGKPSLKGQVLHSPGESGHAAAVLARFQSRPLLSGLFQLWTVGDESPLPPAREGASVSGFVGRDHEFGFRHDGRGACRIQVAVTGGGHSGRHECVVSC